MNQEASLIEQRRKEKIKLLMRTGPMMHLRETMHQDGIAFHVHNALLMGVAYTRQGRIELDDAKLDEYLKDPEAMVRELRPGG